jgi:alpha-ketoglutarate-dependent taurine dioxygenase
MADFLLVGSIVEERVFEGNTFPLTLTSSLRKESFCNELNSDSNRLKLDNLLRTHKAILFRDIQELTTAEDFHDVILATGYQGMDYIGGAAVRTKLTDRVFTANESPSSEVIPFHHEMAQTPNPPTHLFFFCERPATTGGETPILISNMVYQQMVEKHPLFMSKLEQLGVKYVRFLSEEDDPSSAIGRGWKSTFLCQDRGESLK